ncbi:MAG: DUF3644 domain-containing protein [Ruminococcus sp.]|nr:DUF3644 domain-containing protein [Ruminococcus sp.]
MINKFGSESIYYKDNPNRTITLENCVKKVFTNDKAPLRRNLEKIIELRNTSTHFITQEYEMVYIPLFQATVFNFIEKMQAFHDVDMTEIIPQNFLTLTVSYNALDTALVSSGANTGFQISPSVGERWTFESRAVISLSG